jgi:hypothetical protein
MHLAGGVGRAPLIASPRIRVAVGSSLMLVLPWLTGCSGDSDSEGAARPSGAGAGAGGAGSTGGVGSGGASGRGAGSGGSSAHAGAGAGGGGTGGGSGVGGGAGVPATLGARCASICTRAQAASCPSLDYTECLEHCGAYGRTVAAGICPDEIDDFVGCLQALSDPCVYPSGPITQCTAEALAQSECVAAFCEDPAHASMCS